VFGTVAATAEQLMAIKRIIAARENGSRFRISRAHVPHIRDARRCDFRYVQNESMCPGMYKPLRLLQY